ncbi:protein-L-isoaspartate O-methyltransferase family protein [Sphingomonas crusticola]|uniref:protein-L-isoaspartate O-methyltransferase family protein n=1 Tax=Sphingomonas crusticola TaxID=1697973 RepID=UPI000E254BA3|nr:protein-L-isoaspartate O-methyltransferase [Sphingomonas crusticola]
MNKTPEEGNDKVTEHNFEQMRRAMVASQLRTTAVNDPRVVAAMGAVARERFLPASQAALAYLDAALPISPGRAMPAPMVLGRLLTEARVKSSDHALVIGAGGGYAAAVLAELAGTVVALEEDVALVGDAPLPARVSRVTGPLTEGWSEGAPYDLILFDGAIERVPPTIIAQMADGGRLAAPIVENGVSRLAIGRKAGDGFGMITFADAEAPALPGFAVEKGFTF